MDVSTKQGGAAERVLPHVDRAWADEPTPKPQEGTWTLTAPDGRQWTAESPLRVCAAESSERVPAHVRLARIARACDEDDAQKVKLWTAVWYGSPTERGWSIFESNHGDCIAHVGEDESAGRITHLIVQQHNDSVAAATSDALSEVAALRKALEKAKSAQAGEQINAARVLSEFAKTAPGRLPSRVQEALAVIDGVDASAELKEKKQ